MEVQENETLTLNESRIPLFRDKPALYALGAGILFAVCWTFFNSGHAFFWDTLLYSRQADWYLGTGFTSLVVPENIDAGHPPLFSLYLALCFKLFGQHIAVAHFAMLPLLVGLMWQSLRIGRRLLPEGLGWTALVFLLLEPTILAQSSLVSPDIALLFLYLLGVNAILDQKHGYLALAVAAMALISLRGTFMSASLLLSQLLLARFGIIPRLSYRAILPYLPGALLFLGWMILHRNETGWLFGAPAGTYGGHRAFAGLGGIMRNAMLISWRILDYGRIFLWIPLLLWFFELLFEKGAFRRSDKTLWILLLVPLIVLSLFFLPFSNPIGHRYYMVVFFFGGMLVIRAWDEWKGRKAHLLGGLLISAGLLSGHFWVYPSTIAQGWDATLAHQHWYSLRQQADDWVEELGLSERDICSDFPNLDAEQIMAPGAPERRARPYRSHEGKLGDCEWVIQSNVMNGFNDGQLKELEKDYETVRNAGRLGVYVRLLRRK